MENITVEKPWGWEEHLKLTEKNWVKLLCIKPEQRISLQNHKNRNEIWTVVEGKGIVTLDTDEYVVRKHDTIMIPEAVKHRVHNFDKEKDLIICEVATGAPKDDDVFRYEDDYGRK